jgi:Flp pilus assembly protein TadG
MKGAWNLVNRKQRGSTLLEFAIVIVLLLTMMFGVVDFGRALYAYHFVANAAREASRYASVRGSTWTSNPCGTNISTPGCSADAGNVQSYVQNLATGIGLGNTQSSTILDASLVGRNPPNGRTDCATGSPVPPGCVAEVEVDYAFNFILPLMPKTTCSRGTPEAMTISGSICMSSVSRMVVSQ